MANDTKSRSSELLSSYNQFLSELVGARLATRLTSDSKTAVTGAIAAMGFVPVVAPALTAASIAKRANQQDKKSPSATQPDSEQSLAKEIVEEVKDCITDSNNIVYFSDYIQKRDNDKESLPIELEAAIEELVSDIDTAQTLDKLSRDAFMGKFADRFGKRRQDESERPAPLSEAEAKSASDKFRIFLERQGLGKPDAARIAALHATFVQKELPELSVLAAVQELRNQFSPVPVKPKNPYPGKRVYPDARKFLIDNYGEEIDNGQMTPGKLQELDKALYMALYRDVDGTTETVADLVEPKGKPYAKRAAASATILGASSPEEAGRFFGGLRVDRIAKHESAKRSM